MSDNILLNSPSVPGGKTVATKDVGGAQHELVIQEFVDGGGNPVEVSSTNPLPVTDAVSEAALTSLAAEDFATHTAQIDSTQKTQITDAGGNQVTVTGNKLDVNATFSGTVSENVAQLGGNNIDTNSGVKGAGTQRIVIATDQPTLTNPIPVSATVLPLPTGASTSALQTTGNTSLASIDTKLTNPLPVSQSSQPLPTGASTSALQNTGNTSLASIDTKLTNPLPVSASTLPLPTLAATSTKQSDGSQKSQIVDGSGNVIASTSNALNVNISGGSITPSGTQDENLKQVNGATVNVGIGASGTGTQRVAVANDSTIGLLAGAAIIGKVGIDQTTPGTTNGVQVNAALPAGSNVIGHVIADSGSTTAVTGTVSTSEVAPTAIFNGKVTVTTAGTRVSLGSQAIKSVTIKAAIANTGIIYVGNTTVAAANGFELSAGDTISIDIANLNVLDIDSSTNSQSITYIANA